MSKVLNIGLIFAAFGAVFAGIGGWFLWDDWKFGSEASTSQGTIIEMVSYRDNEGDTMYRPVAEFHDANGTRYEFSSRVSSSSPAFSRGEQVSVYYDPANPGDARIDSFSQRYLLPVAFVAMGMLFVVIGGGVSISQILRKRTVERLKRNGVRVPGTVTRVFQDTSFAVNDEHPWRVVATACHPRTGVEGEFKSDALWGRPHGVRVGDSVPVILSPTDEKISFVDVGGAAEQSIAEKWDRPQRRRAFGRRAFD